MFYIIYKTTNIINEKFYIGAHKTSDLNDNYLGSGKLLIQAIKKYGVENFKKEILYVYNNSSLMYLKESELIDRNLLNNSQSYNLKLGGFGGWDHVSHVGVKRTIQTREKLSKIKKITQIGSGNSFYGKTHNGNSKKLIGESSKKRALSDYNKRMSENNHPNSQSICPHCNKMGQKRALKRWHFDNCKFIDANQYIH